MLVHVSWVCPQSNPSLRVSGYKVLVDGRQYGTSLHAGVKNVRIKLGLTHLSHKLSQCFLCCSKICRLEDFGRPLLVKNQNARFLGRFLGAFSFFFFEVDWPQVNNLCCIEIWS